MLFSNPFGVGWEAVKTAEVSDDGCTTHRDVTFLAPQVQALLELLLTLVGVYLLCGLARVRLLLSLHHLLLLALIDAADVTCFLFLGGSVILMFVCIFDA